MADTPPRSIHKTRHKMFRRLKTAFGRRTKKGDMSLNAPEPSALDVPAKQDRKVAQLTQERLISTIDFTADNPKSNNQEPMDHWQMAYEKLSESDQNTLGPFPVKMAAKDPNTDRLGMKEILDNSREVQSVAFSPDGQLLASGSADQTVKLWDPATGALRQTLEGHSHWVRSVTFSPDGQLLASGSDDQTVKLWDPVTGTLKHTIDTDENITDLEFSKQLPLLNTNAGCYDIHAWQQGFSINSEEIRSEVSLQENRWVAVQGRKQLWLPPDYEPICSTVRDGTMAFGCRNGRVCILSISV